MASEYSFDVVSKIDLQELTNALDQVTREIENRFDFRGSIANVSLNDKKDSLILKADDEFRLTSLIEILTGKLIKRGVSTKALEYQKMEMGEKNTVRQSVKIQQGLSTEQAKDIVKKIKDSKLKVTPSIQKDQVRVASKSKDDLQAVMKLLESLELEVDLQFINYR